MSLIDETYFVGELDIPNTSDEDVQVRLAHFIEKYEAKFLTDVLGYDLHKAFIAGLSINPVAAQWTSLLFGADYVYNTRLTPWKGLIQIPVGVAATINNSNTLEMTVGGPGQYDPAPNTMSVTIPSFFSGVPVALERAGIGQMPTSHYSIVGNVLTLTNGTSFNNGEVFFLKKNTTIGISPASTTALMSPIANYVYYWWMRNEMSQTTGIGEVATKGANSTRVSPAGKMTKAWNEMVDQVWELVNFLDTSVVNYPQWSWYGSAQGSYWRGYNHARLKDLFQPINSFNL